MTVLKGFFGSTSQTRDLYLLEGQQQQAHGGGGGWRLGELWGEHATPASERASEVVGRGGAADHWKQSAPEAARSSTPTRPWSEHQRRWGEEEWPTQGQGGAQPCPATSTGGGESQNVRLTNLEEQVQQLVGELVGLPVAAGCSDGAGRSMDDTLSVIMNETDTLDTTGNHSQEETLDALNDLGGMSDEGDGARTSTFVAIAQK
uniref:uncharacterized protein n=1 Tax=Pristiophorus japonicus TaxID=55135 RepID=UPI00398E5814